MKLDSVEGAQGKVVVDYVVVDSDQEPKQPNASGFELSGLSPVARRSPSEEESAPPEASRPQIGQSGKRV
jgi:hypothetical protein